METTTHLPIKILLCDDNPVVLAELRRITEEEFAGIPHTIFATADPDAERLRETEFQIAVLDVMQPKISGIALAQLLISATRQCQIIFVSGYVDCVTDVYTVPHLSLILKDRLRELLPQQLRRAVAELRRMEKALLIVSAHGTIFQIRQSSVCYVERLGHASHIICVDGRDVTVPDKLDSMEQQLNPVDFCRCHVSYLINFQNVAAYQRKQFTMQNGTIVPVSRINSDRVHGKYMEFLSGGHGTAAVEERPAARHN
jgi:DNA-binding LytR/AlgR family response regulator